MWGIGESEEDSLKQTLTPRSLSNPFSSPLIGYIDTKIPCYLLTGTHLLL